MTMKTIWVILLICCAQLISPVPRALAGENDQRNWHFNLMTAYTSRELSGQIIKRSAIAEDVFGNLVATGDSMNVGTSDSLMLKAGAQYKRWGLGVNYLPTGFSGQGYAVVDIGSNLAGLAVKTPLVTDVSVDMLLGNLFYNFIQNENMVFGIGVGFGRTNIDLNIVPQVGDAIIYQGDQPFGFLNLHMANRYKRFLYGFSLNGISATFEGTKVDYSDYQVELGYRVVDKGISFDIVGGYRMVNFDIDIAYGTDEVSADVRLAGPFIGVNVAY